MKLAFFTLKFLLSASAGVLVNEDIVGGANARIEDFPYQISVQVTPHNWQVEFSSKLRVRAGSAQHNSGGKLLHVAQVLQHPDYEHDTQDIKKTLLSSD
ncbi:hypothetical protein BDV06DRAFT_218667 [Aspergillus oleicola]